MCFARLNSKLMPKNKSVNHLIIKNLTLHNSILFLRKNTVKEIMMF